MATTDRVLKAGCLLAILTLLCGCSGRELGWTTDLWGNPYPPDPAELEAQVAEMDGVRERAEELRVTWTERSQLEECTRLYEQVLAYAQERGKGQLEEHYKGLNAEQQAQFGPPEKQAEETHEEFVERANRRFSALREATQTEYDAQLYESFWKLSNSYYLLAEMLTSDADAELRLELYDKGLTSSERGLDCFPSFRKAFAAGEAEEDAVKTIGIDGIEAIYWTAVNLGKWSRQMGFSYVLFNKNKAKSMIEYIRELDDQWYYGGADRYLGAFYSVAPSIAGGDMELSKEHFDKSISIAPDYYGTHVLLAEYYATKMQDRELFESELNFVINGPLDVLPDVIPLQRIEKEKARVLLENIDEYF